MAVDDSNFLSLRGRTDKGTEVFDNERKESYWVFISQLSRKFWITMPVSKRVGKRLNIIPSPTAPAPTKRMSLASLNLERHSPMNLFSSSFELGKLSGPGQCEPIHTARTRSILDELNEPNKHGGTPATHLRSSMSPRDQT